MIVDRLRVSDFRNLSFADLQLSHGLNCFTGDNGAGKTSLLEAFYVAARARSFRSPRTDAVIKAGSPGCSISVQGFDSKRIHHAVVFRKAVGEHPKFQVDGLDTRKLSAVARLFPLQLITPDCADLVFLGPQERRMFLDWGLFHVKQTYSALIHDFNLALRQRNAWLQTLVDGADRTNDPWLSLLDALSAQIDEERRHYCAKLFPIARTFLERFKIGDEINFDYFRGWSTAGAPSLREALLQSIGPAQIEKVTRLGPHRADLRITKCGQPGNQHLSRGQAKLVAIALKLAQASLLNEVTTEKTTILFDELVAELDAKHVDTVLSLMADLGCQVLLSAVEVSEKLQTGRFRHAKMFHVEQGVIREIRE